jgi:hypothetical protein
LNKDRRNFNVIGIDWHEMAQPPYYYSAAKNTETVGKFIGKKLVIDILINILDQNPKKIHAIGHSLGAHVSGHIGREVQNSANAKIGRVTGTPQNPSIHLISKIIIKNVRKFATILFLQVWIQRSHISTKLLKIIENSYARE